MTKMIIYTYSQHIINGDWKVWMCGIMPLLNGKQNHAKTPIHPRNTRHRGISNPSWGMPHPTMPPAVELPSPEDWRDRHCRKLYMRKELTFKIWFFAAARIHLLLSAHKIHTRNVTTIKHNKYWNKLRPKWQKMNFVLKTTHLLLTFTIMYCVQTVFWW